MPFGEFEAVPLGERRELGAGIRSPPMVTDSRLENGAASTACEGVTGELASGLTENDTLRLRLLAVRLTRLLSSLSGWLKLVLVSSHDKGCRCSWLRGLV